MLSTQISPPCRFIAFLHKARPIPRPPDEVLVLELAIKIPKIWYNSSLGIPIPSSSTLNSILAIFGFRSSSKAVLIGMLVGFITVLSFKLFFETDSMIPGMLANLIFFIGSHYVLREPGGWVGIKETASLDTVRVNRKRTIKRIVQSIVEFNLLKSFKDNLPKEEKIQVYFGLFCVISIFSNAYSLPKILAEQYANILYPIYYSTLILSTI